MGEEQTQVLFAVSVYCVFLQALQPFHWYRTIKIKPGKTARTSLLWKNSLQKTRGHRMPSSTVCPSWTAGMSRLMAGRPAGWARCRAGHATTVREALHSRKRRRSLVLRKALMLSLADRPLLGCTSRNRNNPLVWLQCCSHPCCSARTFVSLQGITPTDPTSRQKPSTFPR